VSVTAKTKWFWEV